MTAEEKRAQLVALVKRQTREQPEEEVRAKKGEKRKRASAADNNTARKKAKKPSHTSKGTAHASEKSKASVSRKHPAEGRSEDDDEESVVPPPKKTKRAPAQPRSNPGVQPARKTTGRRPLDRPQCGKVPWGRQAQPKRAGQGMQETLQARLRITPATTAASACITRDVAWPSRTFMAFIITNTEFATIFLDVAMDFLASGDEHLILAATATSTLEEKTELNTAVGAYLLAADCYNKASHLQTGREVADSLAEAAQVYLKAMDVMLEAMECDQMDVD
ncbi:hypothetical protein C8R43DRAFT_1132859 [Mycena crocata]|nr:hypothetical protein C8R43DRAFT_1132859 [Mycena crocata]